MSTPVITIFVRHSEDCKYARDEFSRRCSCRKHFRWTQNGKQYRQKSGTRTWAEAEEAKQALLAQLTGRIDDAEKPQKTLVDATAVFLADKTVQGVSAGVIARYKSELTRLASFCNKSGVWTVSGLTPELMTGYAGTWAMHKSTNTRAQCRKLLRSFLRFCHESHWLDRLPRVPPVPVEEPPTLPLSDVDYLRLLETLDRMAETKPHLTLRGKTRPIDPATHVRLRALIQLMRWSGLAIMDAVRLPFAEVQYDQSKGLYRVVTSRTKTAVPVSVVIPKTVAEELLAVPPAREGYPFCASLTGRFSSQWWGKNVRAVFEMTGIRSGRMVSHRLRDTFAVGLLKKGVPMEEVSRALGHTSIRTTEKHYSAWVKGRQDRLDSLVTATWSA